MKITDFEDDFDDKVLTRGYAYYKGGAILSVELSEDNCVLRIEDEVLAGELTTHTKHHLKTG